MPQFPLFVARKCLQRAQLSCEQHRAPGAFFIQENYFSVWPKFSNARTYLFGERGLFRKIASGQNEADPHCRGREAFDAADGVGSQAVRGGLQYICRNFVVSFGRLENLRRQRRDVRFGCVLDPANQFVRMIQLQRAQNSRAQGGPDAVPIVKINDGFESAQSDFESAPLIPENVSPSSDFCGATVG